MENNASSVVLRASTKTGRDLEAASVGGLFHFWLWRDDKLELFLTAKPVNDFALVGLFIRRRLGHLKDSAQLYSQRSCADLIQELEKLGLLIATLGFQRPQKRQCWRPYRARELDEAWSFVGKKQKKVLACFDP